LRSVRFFPRTKGPFTFCRRNEERGEGIHEECRKRAENLDHVKFGVPRLIEGIEASKTIATNKSQEGRNNAEHAFPYLKPEGGKGTVEQTSGSKYSQISRGVTQIPE